MRAKFKSALLGAAFLGGLASTATLAETKVPVGTLAMAGPTESSRVVHFDVFLPLRNKGQLEALVKAQTDPKSSQYHKFLTAAQFGAQFGPDRATVDRLAGELQARGFQVKEYMRSIRVTGTADLVGRNFGAQLVYAKGEDGASHVVTNDTINLPKDFTDAGAQVLSFAPHAAHVFSHVVSKEASAAHGSTGPLGGVTPILRVGQPANRLSPTGGYLFDDLKQAYQYPAVTDSISVGGTPTPFNGTGATIAAMMSSDILDADIQAMFDEENWSSVSGTPDPTIQHLYIEGGAPFNDYAGAEASLDTQMEIGGAPGAHVILLDIPDLSDGSVMAGLVDEDEYGFAQVVSMSFGQCELDYFPSLNDGHDYRAVLVAEHELFLQGNSEGITFLASSGDEAGRICPTPQYFQGQASHYAAGVSVPASDPNVTAVGGTNLVTTYVQGSLTSAYAGENAWDDPEYPDDPYGVGVDLTGHVWGAGGGYSQMWPAPSYQSMVTTGSTMRAVPDIGMQVGGCPYGASDYHPHLNTCFVNSAKDGLGNNQRSYVYVAIQTGEGGGFYGLIGTSVSSPEFASAVAHLVEKNGPMGNLNNYIYAKAAAQAAGTAVPFYHTNIPGFNGLVNTDLNSTYSLSTGVGTPLVTNFLGAPSAVPAGVPQTAGNP